MDGGAFQRDRDAALSRDDSYGDGRGGVDVQTQQGFGTERPYGRTTQQGPYGWGHPGRGFGYGRGGGFRTETRPSFLTSEFVGTILAIVALGLTAAAMPNLGARLTWILIATMVATYAFSRGLAKAGTASHAFDPREQLLGGTNDQGAGSSQGGFVSRGPIETKPFFITSEFVGTLLAIIAIAISAATLD